MSFSVLVNGSPEGYFKPSRGLCQGDPLSPFLFILCSEVLSRLLVREIDNGNLKGINICRNNPCISHLLFADNLIVFGKATIAEAQKIMECINKYGQWSGQCLNMAKSSIHFSKNMANDTTWNIASHVGLKRAEKNIKYLGLPLILERSKKAAFEGVVEHVKKRLQGWKSKVLSQAARGTLI